MRPPSRPPLSLSGLVPVWPLFQLQKSILTKRRGIGIVCPHSLKLEEGYEILPGTLCGFTGFFCWSELSGKESYLLLWPEFPGKACSFSSSLGPSGRPWKGPLGDGPMRGEILCRDPPMAGVAQDIKILQVALGSCVLPFSDLFLTLPLFYYFKITRDLLEVFLEAHGNLTIK